MTDRETEDPVRTLRVIVQAERLVAELNEHNDRLARFIEEERDRDGSE